MPKCRLCNQNNNEEDLHIICHKSNNHSIWCTTCIEDIIQKAENKNNIILTCQLCNSENILNYEIESNLEKSISYEYNNGNLHGEEIIIYYTNKFGDDYTKIKSIGNYNNGKLYGIYIEYDEDGYILMICNYNEGKLNGIYYEYINGKIYSDIIYENGLKNGIKNYYHYKNDDNKIIIQTDMYKDDMLNGKSIIYNVESGEKVYEINYKNNMKDGMCIEYIYDENNNLINSNIIEYKEDKIYNGIENIYYDDKHKKIKSSVLYVNGMKEGIKKMFYENNNIKYEQKYEKDVLNGKCVNYDINGNIILEENYHNGVLDGIVNKNIYKEKIKNIRICGINKEEKKIDNHKSYSYEELLNNQSFLQERRSRNMAKTLIGKSSIETTFRTNQFSDFGLVEEEENNSQTEQLDEQFSNSNFEEHKSMMNDDEDPFIRKIKEFSFM